MKENHQQSFIRQMPACVNNVRKSTLGLGIKVKLNQALMIVRKESVS